MSEQRLSIWRHVLRIPVEIVVAIFVVLDALIAPLFGPFMRALSSLQPIRRLEAFIGRMPPYLILVLLAVPFGFAELAKVYAVILMAEDHLHSGMTIFIGAYIVSILVCERTFHAGRGQLMKIGWFKVAFDWLMSVKAQVFGWLERTRAWQAGVTIKDRCRIALSNMRGRLQDLVGQKPKGSLERP